MSELERLITWLLDDNKDGGGYLLPPGIEAQERLLRSLMNVWQPHRMPDAFWRLQDTVLQQQLAHRGIVAVEDLPGCRTDPRIIVWQGDITRLSATAIVNAANSAMLGCFVPCHGCVDNAIHSAAGLQLRLFCKDLMERQGHGEPTGTVKLTPAFNLPSSYIMHTVGPIVSGTLTQEDRRLLADCYTACLTLANNQSMDSLAFCCISTGEFGFPQKEAAEIAIQTVRDGLRKHTEIGKVIFNVYQDSDLRIYQELLGIG